MAQIFNIFINDHSVSFSKTDTPNVHYPVMREAKNSNNSRNGHEMLTNNVRTKKYIYTVFISSSTLPNYFKGQKSRLNNVLVVCVTVAIHLET